MSDSSVITNEDGWVKRGYSSNYCRPKFAVMNPELTMTLPQYQTMSGCVDIMMHTMERYLNHADNMELTDGISEHLLRTVMKNAKILLNDPANYDARAEVMWAECLMWRMEPDWRPYGEAGQDTWWMQDRNVLHNSQSMLWV